MAYAYQATVTVPAPTGGPHTDFTIVFAATSALLKPVASGGAIQVSGAAFTGGPTVPFDFIVSSDAAGSSLYSWTPKSWDQANGIVYVYVRIPSYSVGLTLYVSIGNGSVVGFLGGARGSAFRAAVGEYFPFPPGSGTLNVSDFSSTALAATNSGATAAAGQIDGAASFSGSPNYVALTTGFAPASAFCVSAWINPSNLTGFKSIVGGSSGSFGLRVANSTGKIFGTRSQTADDQQSTVGVSASAWSLVAMVQDSSHNYIYYINGVARGSFASGQFNWTTNTTSIGAGEALGEFFTGLISDILVSSDNPSADWMTTMYANQSSLPSASAFSPIGGSGDGMLALLGAGS